MEKRKMMLLVGALVIAIGTALAARSMLAGGGAPAVQAVVPVPKGPKVLVAQRALPVGTIITADAVNFQEWPKDLVRDAYFLDGSVDMNKLVGTVVRFPITAGQPLTQGALVAPGDRGFLAAALGPGMRAMTVPVSDKSSVGGFIFPGDHVDLMLTQTVNATDGGQPLKVSETVLRNLRVLATDQSTETETANGKTVVHGVHLVTFEVTPRLAEKIEVAQTVGALSLVLRSIADNQSEMDKAIASGSIKLPASASKLDQDRALTEAMNKPQDGATTFSTGGDVSRFQRRTVPPQGATAVRGMVKDAINTVADRLGLPRRDNEEVRVTRGRDTAGVTPLNMFGAGGNTGTVNVFGPGGNAANTIANAPAAGMIP